VILTTLLAALPDQPDADEARELAERELAKHVYDAAQPTLIDRIALAIGDFLDSLTMRGVGASWSPIVVVIVIAVIVALIAVGLAIWGRPKLANRRASESALLFGEDDGRSAAELRADAASNAAAGRWDEAIVSRFRAVARSLDERDVIDPIPGLTATGLAALAADFFPAQAAGVRAAAGSFDDVRYLRRPGTAEMYAVVAEVDDEVARARPAKLAFAFAEASA